MSAKALLRLLGLYGVVLMIERAMAVTAEPARAAPGGVPPGREPGATRSSDSDRDGTDRAPGEREEHGTDIAAGLRTYGIGLALALILTGLSFFVAGGRSFVWGPAVPIALVVLAIAQIGVHLVFFLHLTTGPDNTNNVLALAFGTLIVFLVLAGTLWIMANLDHNMMPPGHVMPMQR